jgi:proteasome lid subunit RPN8/RPN11
VRGDKRIVVMERKARVRVLPPGGRPALPAAGERDGTAPELQRGRSDVPARPGEIYFRPAEHVEVTVCFRPAAWAALLQHCDESNQHGNEICGLLVGTVAGPVRDGRTDQYSLEATDILRLESSDASGAHVSADPETWARIDEQMQQPRFTGKDRLGWYHTHPTQGVFFSGSDRNFHAVFNRPFQFALVVDPRERIVGLFHWRDRAAQEIAGPLWLDSGNVPPAPAGPDVRGARQFQPGRGRRTDHRSWLLLAGLLGFAAILISVEPADGSLALLAGVFTAALALRLWNAAAAPGPRASEPAAPPAQGVSAGTSWQFGALSMALQILLLACFSMAWRAGWLAPPPQPPASGAGAAVAPVEPASVAADATGGSEAGSAAFPDPVPGRVSAAPVEVQADARSVLFRWHGNGRTYQARYLRDGLTVTRVPDEERALLTYLIGVERPTRQELKRLQEALHVALPTGKWEAASRNALVGEAVKLSQTRYPLELTREGQVVRSIPFWEGGVP